MPVSNTIESTEELKVGTPAGTSKDWNYHPDIPINYSPLFNFPPNPVAILKWFARAWLPLTELTCYLLLATLVWLYFQPPLTDTTALEFSWVGLLWARNFIMMSLLAGGLHLWLYRWRRQGDSYEYINKLPNEIHKKYLFNNQLLDNVFWTLASGVTVWSIYETIMWLALANNIAPMITFAENPIWFVIWFPLIGIWYSFHFYWVHRFLHYKPMYLRFHSVHHRNINVGPWSGFSMHTVEHLLYLSSLFIHFLVPSHPVHILFHAYWLTLATATSHSGYEALILGKNSKTTISTFFHQLHHRYFHCNYGNTELPLDRWFGSFNDGSTAATKRVLLHKNTKSALKL